MYSLSQGLKNEREVDLLLSRKRGLQAKNSQHKGNHRNFLGTAKEQWSWDGGGEEERERKGGKGAGQGGREVRQGHKGIVKILDFPLKGREKHLMTLSQV